jgi:hypothetical protein
MPVKEKAWLSTYTATLAYLGLPPFLGYGIAPVKASERSARGWRITALLCSLTLLLFILKQVEDISSIFPFAISEKEELTEITLTRSLKTEQIEVLVSMPKLDQDVKDDEGLLSPSKEDQEDEGKTPPEKYSLPIRVTVSKADGSGLVFTCTANPDDIVIEGLSIRRKPLGAKEGDAVTYEEGP